MSKIVETQTTWLAADEQLAWRSFIKLYSLLVARLDAELIAAHLLPLAEYEVLVHLSEAEDGALRMSALANRVLVSRSGLTRRLENLIAQGLVTKETCASDRRGTIARLTDQGRSRLIQAAPTHVEGVRRYFISRFAKPELHQFSKLLQAVIEAFEQGGTIDQECTVSLECDN